MNSFEKFLKHQVDSGKTPSIQYSVFNGDSIVYELSYGLSDIRFNRPADLNTTYHIYSITKTFTALAILQLVRLGMVKLDRPVFTYLPHFPYSRDVSVQHLLNHTAGIPNPLPLNWIHLSQEHIGFNRDEFFNTIFAKHSTLKNTPGSKFAYSNLGYVILGQIIEAVSGISFESFIRANVLRPLNLKPVEIDFDFQEGLLAKGYQKIWSFTNLLLGLLMDKKKFMDKAEGDWKPFKSIYVNGTSYGGLISSVKGLVTYARALLGVDGLLLSEADRQLLFTENKINGKGTGMCLSWFTGILKDNRYYGHPGGGGGYYAELRVYPKLGLGSVIMLNRSGMRNERLLDHVDTCFL